MHIADSGGKIYLVCIDKYPKWAIFPSDKSSVAIIDITHTIFCTHGYPKYTTPDNTISVSYTHLDVYKRQTVGRVT